MGFVKVLPGKEMTGDVKNGNVAIKSKTTQAKLMKFSPKIEHKISLKNTKFYKNKKTRSIFGGILQTRTYILQRPNVISRTTKAMYSKLCPAKFLITNS